MTQADHAIDKRDKSGELPIHLQTRIPEARTLWFHALLVGVVVLVYFLIDEFTYVLLDLWLLQSLQLEEVFWTNFRMGALLFVIGFAGIAAGTAAPALTSQIEPGWRRLFVLVGVLLGLIGGYFLANQYQAFLQLFNGVPFQKEDPIFNRDIGFYVFSLPAIWTIWMAVTIPLFFGLISSVLCAALAHRGEHHDGGMGLLAKGIGIVSTPRTLVTLTAIGIASAVGVWLSRYDLLWKENYEETIFAGAQYVDVTGLFSYLNYYYVSAIVILLVTGLGVLGLHRLHQAVTRSGSSSVDQQPTSRKLGLVIALLIAFDFGFAGVVALRDITMVTPNEPVVQLPYIKHHIDATLAAYGLDKLETVSFTPNGPDAPLPDPDALLKTATLRNAPLWPGWVGYLERVLDPHHVLRITQTGGDPMIYGPLIDIFRQQQKLRTYYDFLDVDTVRYKIDGETTIFASAVRELPLRDPQPWLYAWGQRHLLYTHGHGMVMTPVAGIQGEGEPAYASLDIPVKATSPVLLAKNPAVYYGEGSEQMAFSNAQGIKELDYPTDEGRAEVEYLPDIDAGVRMDSLLKRLVIGWRSGVFLDVLFSDLVASESRAHYYRKPLERLDRIVPFLFLDTNNYAVTDGEGIFWIAHAMATTDMYPYSRHEVLGDKSQERSYERQRPDRWVNYARDSVKATVDAYTGKVNLYKITDDPVIETWSRIYPNLFKSGDSMPQSVRDHLQYPPVLMHTQFDNIFKRYHMTDPLTYFNMEDLWDDADEVKGPILDRGESITFSIEPYNWLAETGQGVLPASESRTQFTLSMVFTNEKALNLRAIPMAYQDGADYGRLFVLQVPKGYFYPSPEQADSAIDQEPSISEQISWWNRMGAEVIHGHTTPLVIGNEVIYVAPLFIRSQQNQLSQIKRVIVVFRGHPADGTTLEEALRRAIDKAAKSKGLDQRGLFVSASREKEVDQIPETAKPN